jgi:hypothetical protein
MRTGRYSIAELFGNRHIEQLVIPEIQRDYVWEPKQVEHLVASIMNSFKDWQREKAAPPLQVVARNSPDGPFGEDEVQSLQNEFAAFYARRTHATNVGFIYAYCDADLPGQYALIDGQQRLTTIYLALLATATRDPGLKERFRARYCLCPPGPHTNEAAVPTKLDYRLREHTAEFLRRFVDYFLDNSATLDQLREQSWYLHRHDSDTTVRNLFGNYKTIQQQLEGALSDAEPSQLYEYLEDLVECWYFDTNESAQGEELYLYLNARGESIADNENRKARLLAGVGDSTTKDKWGRTWEEWQDYFWQNRKVGLSEKDSNPNADRGFNSFLVCIENLERLRGRRVAATDPVNLEIIDKYLCVLRWLNEQKEPFKAFYTYAGWVNCWFSEVWGIFNQPDATEWAATLSDKNKSIAHNRMVLVWGSLLCVACALEKENGECKKLDHRRIFRAIRIFYLRYHNFGRAVASLPETVRGILDDNPDVLGGEQDATEERAKWEFLNECPDEERCELESVIWRIEDHPLNRNGRDLGGVNITHLTDLAVQVTTLPQLKTIRDTFYELFPPEEDGESDKKKKVASALLYYGAFWDRVRPWYYENYELGDWRRTIRGKGSMELKDGSGTVFRRFFDDFLQAGQSLDEFVEGKKGSETVDPRCESDLRKALIWYCERLKERLFEKGMYLAKDTSMEKGHDEHFPNLCALWNTKGHFRGVDGNQKLADLIEEETK